VEEVKVQPSPSATSSAAPADRSLETGTATQKLCKQ
jgi:hypothetical protein